MLATNSREGEGELAGRVHLPKENISKGVSEIVTTIEGLARISVNCFNHKNLHRACSPEPRSGPHRSMALPREFRFG